MKTIKKSIYKFKQDLGRYPENVVELIGNNPTRKKWEKDEWGSKYRLIENDSYLELISA